MKKCFKCGIEKPLSEFYKHKRMSDGHLNKCKECAKADTRQNRERNIDKCRAYDRTRSRLEHRKALAKRSRQKNPSVHIESGSKWAQRNRLKRNAHYAVYYAVKNGHLAKQPCEVCGTTEGIQAHHDDYTKPLQVRWLCVAHHKQHHRIYKD